MGALLALGAFAVVLMFLIGIAAYIFMSLGLMTLAQKKGIENPWLAWIPIANFYILGKIIVTLNIFNIEITQLPFILMGGAVAAAVFGAIPVLGWIIGIAFAVLIFFALHKLFLMYAPDKAVIYVVLSIIFSFIGLFGYLIYSIRNNDETVMTDTPTV